MPSLRANIVWAFAGNVVFSLCQWLVLIVITKLGSTSAAGDWSLALAVTGPIFVFAMFRMRQVVTTDARQEYRWSEYAAASLVGTLSACVVTVLVVAVAYRDRTAPIILLIALAKAFDTGSDLVYGAQQQRERLDAVGRSQIGRGLSSAVAASVVMWATRNVAMAALATAVAYAAWFGRDLKQLGAVMPVRELRPSWAWSRLAPLLRTVVPLGAVSAIGSLQVNVPRYFVEGYAGRNELGVWASISYVLVLGNMTIGAVGYAASARLAQQAASRDWSAFRRLLGLLVATGATVGILGIIACVLVGEPVLRLVYSDAVARHADLLTLLAVASALPYTFVFLGTALDALRAFRVQPWIHTVTFAVIAVAAAVLVPVHSLRGAAWALLVGYAVQAVLFAVALTVVVRGLAQDAPSG